MLVVVNDVISERKLVMTFFLFCMRIIPFCSVTPWQSTVSEKTHQQHVNQWNICFSWIHPTWTQEIYI